MPHRSAGVFAEFERAMFQERISVRLERVTTEGKKLGRPRIPVETEQAIRKACRGGPQSLDSLLNPNEGIS